MPSSQVGRRRDPCVAQGASLIDPERDKNDADEAFDSATCIGCGACVASCKNSSAMLFVSAKINQFSLLPQGQIETKKRINNMIDTMDTEGFGACSNTGTCEAECPKEISINNIIKINKEYINNL